VLRVRRELRVRVCLRHVPVASLLLQGARGGALCGGGGGRGEREGKGVGCCSVFPAWGGGSALDDSHPVVLQNDCGCVLLLIYLFPAACLNRVASNQTGRQGTRRPAPRWQKTSKTPSAPVPPSPPPGGRAARRAREPTTEQMRVGRRVDSKREGVLLECGARQRVSARTTRVSAP